MSILLVNLGTPANPEPEAVGRYLKEFLMDPFVVDIPVPLRWILVHCLIVPKRKYASSLLYKKIWRSEGSPLLVYTRMLTEALRQKGHTVAFGMRYGNPSIEEGLKELLKGNPSEILVAPLYPQKTTSATVSCIEKAKEVMRRLAPNVSVKFLDSFYEAPEYLDAIAEVTRNALAGVSYDYTLFSFHGLPSRQDVLTEPSYQTQCNRTADEIAARLGLARDRYAVAYQSRLNERWVRPFTDHFYESLPKQGVKNLAVVCPSFVADCLETLEEVAIRGQEQFRKAGGEKVILVPSLNADPSWVNALEKLIRK